MYTRPLSHLRRNDAPHVGGKAASLGEMLHHGLAVPSGFVISPDAHYKFAGRSLPKQFVEELHEAFEALNSERVAVRSSAIGEDSTGASWAGMFETLLNIRKKNLIDAIESCWASASSPRIQAYRATPLSVGVVVQKMLNSTSSGVLFTANPISKTHDELVIEAVFGLGEPLVQGLVTPDSYIVSKKTKTLIDSDIVEKSSMLAHVDGITKQVPLAEFQKTAPTLTRPQLAELAELAVNAEEHYGYPLDIEWAFEGDKLYLLQARPITTL